MVGPIVVKVGGEAFYPERRALLAADVARLSSLGPVVLVHGGGVQLDRAAARAGLPTHRVAGRRVTSDAVLLEAVREWRGWMSSAWVCALAEHGVCAVGVSGLDGGLLRARRRPPVVVRTDDDRVRKVDYGWVGDIEAVNADLLLAVLSLPAVPVVSPLAYGEGGALNVNADTVAAEIAAALGAERLVLLTGAPGIQADPADEATALGCITRGDLDELDGRGALRGGMRPKVAAVKLALDGGVGVVHVADGREPGALLRPQEGTRVVADG